MSWYRASRSACSDDSTRPPPWWPGPTACMARLGVQLSLHKFVGRSKTRNLKMVCCCCTPTRALLQTHKTENRAMEAGSLAVDHLGAACRGPFGMASSYASEAESRLIIDCPPLLLALRGEIGLSGSRRPAFCKTATARRSGVDLHPQSYLDGSGAA